MTHTLFQPFLELLKRLQIDPKPTQRDPFGRIADTEIDRALNQVKDFPLERFPELEAYARETQVLNWDSLIKKMRQMTAQKPAAPAYDDAWIDAYMAKKPTCGCADYPECQPEWRKVLLR